MAITTKKLTRIFRYQATDIPDPTPDLKPEATLEILAVNYPQFANPFIEGPAIEGDKQVFTVKVSAGTKG